MRYALCIDKKSFNIHLSLCKHNLHIHNEKGLSHELKNEAALFLWRSVQFFGIGVRFPAII